MSGTGPVGAPEPLLHLVGRDDWDAACRRGGRYRPADADEVGFVHLSSPAQVLIPAGRFYGGRDDLVVLVLDPRRLTDPVVWEEGVPPEGDLRFPHLYGAVDPDAVVAVVPLVLGPDGRHLPPEVPPLSDDSD